MVKRVMYVLLAIMIGGITAGGVTSHAEVTVFTPLTGLSVTPGEDVEYSVDIINNGSEIEHVTFDVEGLPEGWDYSLSANGTSVQRLAVRPNSEEDVRLVVTVPLQVEKGEYNIDFIANGSNRDVLPMLINVTEEGTFKTDLIVDQPNMQGHADSSFEYNATLKNQTAEEQHYSLSSQAPDGWNVQFRADNKGVTSVTVGAGEEKKIEVVVNPSETVKADTYTIPIQVSSGATTSQLDLEAVITGTYDISISTPDGKLSEDVTAGGEQDIELVVENTGTVDLTDVELGYSTPPNWKVTFDEDTISTLKAGAKETVIATLSAPNDAIAGDYVTTFRAETPEATSQANFRMSVKTSTVWGFVSIAIILVVIGGLYYIFRKYGRR